MNITKTKVSPRLPEPARKAYTEVVRRSTEAHATPLPLRSIKVCHLTPLQSRPDERAFTRESLPATPHGVKPVIVGPHTIRAEVDGVSFMPTPTSRNRFLRILSGLRMVRWALPHRADIYHVHCPELIPAAMVLKFLFGKTVVYDTREDFPAMMLTKTYIHSPFRVFLSRIVAAVERLAAQNLDGVITADSGSLRPLAKIGNSKKLVFYNFPNLRFFPLRAPGEKKYDIVYRGGLSERTGTFVLLQAIKLLVDSGIHPRVLMFGYTDDTASTRAIRESMETLGISNLVTLGGVIPHEEMARTLSSARILVCPLQKIPKFENNIPVKVFEAWACGLSVVATDLPPIRPFLRDRRYGLLVKPGDPEELARAIRNLLASPTLRDEFGRRARQAVVDRYNSSNEISKLLAFYRRVLPC